MARSARRPLHLLNEPQAHVANAPMTLGVPLPRGALLDERNVRLVDEKGAEVPLQTRTCARWSRFGSIKVGELLKFTGWLTLTHTQRWHAHRRSTGSGDVHQGRFKSFAVQDDVTGKALSALVFPLPPPAEQHRIVAKVDELMSVCDQLESQLSIARTDSPRLLEAVLHDALAPAG